MTIRRDNFQAIQTLLAKQTQNELSDDKDYLVETRLAPVASTYGFPSVDALIDRLRGTPDRQLLRTAIEALLIHETFFFRDPATFQYLEETVLPRLCQARLASRSLSIWSAACSSGQEAYSIAISLADRMPHVVAGWNVRLVGTDASSAMIARARLGTYSPLEISRGPFADRVLRHTRNENGENGLSDSLRKMIDFREWNLSGGPLFGQWDIVFLRNVLIYFPEEFRRSLLTRLHRCLCPDGVLFVGASESAHLQADLFQPLDPACHTCLSPK
jgi:chemotaxis protein methyltransferase CheR